MSLSNPTNFPFPSDANKQGSGVVDMSSTKYVNVEFRTSLDSLKAAVKKAGIVRKVNVEMSWEDVFLLQKIGLDAKLAYNVSSRHGCIITSVKKTVGEHIRKFVVPLQLYPVTIELNVKREPVENVVAGPSIPRSFAMPQQIQPKDSAAVGPSNAVARAAAADTRPAHVILLERLLREQMQQLSDRNAEDSEESNSGNDSNYSSDSDGPLGPDEIGDAAEAAPPRYSPIQILWNLPPTYVPEGRLLAASVIETPKLDGVPFLNTMQIKMIAGMLVNRFGLETMVENKFEFVNLLTDAPNVYKQVRDRSKFMCDLAAAVFSDEMFNPPPRRDQDFM